MFRSPGLSRFLPLLLGLAVWAAAESKSDTSKVFVIKAEEASIPLPGGSVYMSRGIYASLSGGQYHNYGDPNGVYQWQGEMGFFYKSWLSGGLGFKMLAGQPSDPVQIVKNRLFVLTRFHKAWSQFSGYLGAEIGVEDLNLSFDTLSVRQPLEKINAGLGLEVGMGWKFSRYVGLTYQERFEGSFVGEDTTSLAGSVNFRHMPGVAVDLLAIAPPLRKNVKALYVFLEVQSGQLILEDSSRKHDLAWITGMTVGF